MSSGLQAIFGDFPISRFIAEHLHRLPLALPGSCRSVATLGSWESLSTLLSQIDADVMVVRQGERCSSPAPRDVATARACCAEGCTIVVRSAERHNEQLARLAQLFADTFRGPVNVHLYATPPGQFGFSWHYDAEDVFILQTAGEKEYFLRKNTVFPWPLEETLPANMCYEQEIMPFLRVVLKAGDLLYIPCGYWHRAQATASEETAISLAIGVMSRSAMDLFRLLGSQLNQSLVWRQRLPLISPTDSPSAKSELEATYSHVLEQLAADIVRTLTSTQFRDRVIDEFVRLDTASPPQLGATVRELRV